MFIVQYSHHSYSLTFTSFTPKLLRGNRQDLGLEAGHNYFFFNLFFVSWLFLYLSTILSPKRIKLSRYRYRYGVVRSSPSPPSPPSTPTTTTITNDSRQKTGKALQTTRIRFSNPSRYIFLVIFGRQSLGVLIWPRLRLVHFHRYHHSQNNHPIYQLLHCKTRLDDSNSSSSNSGSSNGMTEY